MSWILTFGLVAALIGLAVVLLGVRVFFIRGGKFPDIHIGSSHALKDRGIDCATSQDRQAQEKTHT